MSLFGRALAGAGTAAADIANKYIDDALATQRAQALADIQRNSAISAHKEITAYDQSDEVQGQRRKNLTADVVAQGAAADSVTLARAGNTALTQAQIDQTNAVTRGTGPVAAEQAGMVEGAKEAAKAKALGMRTNPGDIIFNTDGTVMVRNDNLTPAQAQLQALREGLKGQGKESRDRAYEAVLGSYDKQIETLTKQINEGVAGGTLKSTAPEEKKNWFSPNEPGKDPAYTAWQDLKTQLSSLTSRRDSVVGEMRGGARSYVQQAEDRRSGVGGDANLGANTGPRGAVDAGLRGSPGIVTPDQQQPDPAGDVAGSLAQIDKVLANKSIGPDQRATLEAERARIAAGTSSSLTLPTRPQGTPSVVGKLDAALAAPPPPAAPAASAAAAPAAANKPLVEQAENARLYADLSPKDRATAAYISDKFVSAPNDLLKLAQTSENPDFRRVALLMYQRLARRNAANAEDAPATTGLGL